MFTIGVDFGTLAVRALVVEVDTGRELASAARNYPHAVMTDVLPDETPLPPDWALQHPLDYLDCLRTVVHEALELSGVSTQEVIGLGIDFTASTTFPVDKEGEPLCMQERFASNPYAWVMLWKHHAAQEYANRMTDLAHENGMQFVKQCGGRISSELMFPRLWQIAVEAPEVYGAADMFIEAGDWITRKLTGSTVRSANPAAYKLFWNPRDGYPSKEFLRKVDPRLEDAAEKLVGELKPLGSRAGTLNAYGAELTGLLVGTAVSVTCIDAHMALPAAGVVEDGTMLLILGTSGAHLVLGSQEHDIPGLLCMTEDGMIPGWFAYEAGQSCCGDHFQWFVDNCVPSCYATEAQQRGIGLHQLLTEKAEALRAGESGLIALDWWNGNRSVLMDAELSGLLVGMTLQTRPEEIYRALIEATAYGTRVIVENFEKHGVRIREINVCGGIARKNPMLMQIYADVLKRRLNIVKSDQTPALGSAIMGAVAAGKEKGGYDSIREAALKMGGTEDTVYKPDEDNSAVYDELYTEYLQLHDWFGRGGSDVMKRLRKIQKLQLPQNCNTVE